MQRVTTIGAVLLALLAIGAVMATAASARTLVLSESGRVLMSGEEFEMEGPPGAFSVRAQEAGFDCGSVSTGVELGVITNSATKDELKLERLNQGYIQGCESGQGFANAYLYLSGPLTLRASGKATGGSVSVDVEFEHIYFHEREYPDVSCIYSRKELSGTNTATSSVQALAVEFAGTLQLASGGYNDGESVPDKHICPKTAEMSLVLNRAEGEGYEPVEEQVLSRQ